MLSGYTINCILFYPSLTIFLSYYFLSSLGLIGHWLFFHLCWFEQSLWQCWLPIDSGLYIAFDSVQVVLQNCLFTSVQHCCGVQNPEHLILCKWKLKLHPIKWPHLQLHQHTIGSRLSSPDALASAPNLVFSITGIERAIKAGNCQWTVKSTGH